MAEITIHVDPEELSSFLGDSDDSLTTSSDIEPAPGESGALQGSSSSRRRRRRRGKGKMKVFQAIGAAEAAMLQKEGTLDENQQLSQTVSNLKFKLSEAEVALAKADKITASLAMELLHLRKENGRLTTEKADQARITMLLESVCCGVKTGYLSTARNPMEPMPGPSPMSRTTQRKETDQWNW